MCQETFCLQIQMQVVGRARDAMQNPVLNLEFLTPQIVVSLERVVGSENQTVRNVLY